MIPMGQLKLLMAMGELPRQAFKYCTFVVVDCSSAYNAIFGRPLLVEFGAVTSIRHLCMKFPTDSRNGTIRGDQKDARQCYRVSVKSLVMMVASLDLPPMTIHSPKELDPRVRDERNMEPLEEGEEVVVDASKPEGKMEIGRSLSSGG